MSDTLPSKPLATPRRVWSIPRAGSLSRLALHTEPLAPPGSGEVQVEVTAVGVNFADVFACLGLYSATPSGKFTPGLECAGRVRSVGADVDRWRPGDRVMVLTRFGGYATALNASAATLWPIPESWSDAEAAAYPVQALTAWYGLTALGNARPGAVVLVQSAAGGVGLNALQALQTLGARAVAVVGSAAKREWLIGQYGGQYGLTPETVIVRSPRLAADLDAALASLGAQGFDVVFDAVYGADFEPSFARLAAEGRHVLFGAADFMSVGRRPNPLRLAWQYLRRPRLDPLAMISQNRGLLAFNLIWLWHEASRLPEAMRGTLALIPNPPHIGGCYAFEDAQAALAAIQSGKTMGKLVLEPHRAAEPAAE
ncbi:MAG: zinc-binding dehydrogenase [Sinobacteraceae bacterium]|nr:zinc-binding dehydrogenase [Nevskiaceae bacterium]